MNKRKESHQISLFDPATVGETHLGQEFLARQANLEEAIRAKLAEALAGDPSDMNVRAFVAALLKTSSEVFVKRLPGLDPKWYLTLANAMLTVAAHNEGVKVPCPLFPSFLPQEARIQLEEAGLIKPGEAM